MNPASKRAYERNNPSLNAWCTMKKFIVLVFVLVFPFSLAYASDGVFYMMGVAPTGSHIPVKLASSNVPFDKNYAELTDQQRAIVRADYEGLAATDVPPYPARGVEQILRPLSKAHRSLLAKGELLAIAMVDANGKVSEVSIYKTPSEHMTKLIAASLYQTEFTPATCGGEACAMEFLLNQELLSDR